MSDTPTTGRADRERRATLRVLQANINDCHHHLAQLPRTTQTSAEQTSADRLTAELAELEATRAWLTDAPAFSVAPENLYDWIGYSVMVGYAPQVITGVEYPRGDRSVVEAIVVRVSRNESTGFQYTVNASAGSTNQPVTVYGPPRAMVMLDDDGRETWRATDHGDRRKMIAALWACNNDRHQAKQDPLRLHLDLPELTDTGTRMHRISGHLLDIAGRFSLDPATLAMWVDAPAGDRRTWPFWADPEPNRPVVVLPYLCIGNDIVADGGGNEDPALTTTLVWTFRSGIVCTGTIAELGMSIESADLAGEGPPVAVYALAADSTLVPVQPTCERSPFDEDQYATTTMTIVLPDGTKIDTGWRVDGAV